MSRTKRDALWRYACVGAAATAVHWAVLAATVEVAHGPAWAASGLGAVVGAQVAYVGNRTLTFRHRGGWWHSWVRFQLTAAGGALLSMALVALAVALGMHYLLGQAIATLTGMLATYAVNRRWSFASTPNRG